MSSITRKKHGKKFDYYDGNSKITNKTVIERVNKLAIPPAWQDVEIAKSSTAKIQARGHDGAGRLQAIYHPTFRIQQDEAKFKRILQFAEALPKLRRQVEKDLNRKKLGKQKILACVVKLIDEEFFRVGNAQYAQQNHSYGITTLRSKHADISSTEVVFDFIGKSGKRHVKTIKDRKLAKIIKQLDDMPGFEIFSYKDETGTHRISSHDVNEYIKTYMGEAFSAKDFRTWGGTLLATSTLLKEELADDATKTERKKVATQTVKLVAKRLGNTPTVARSSYIDPRVFVAFEDGKPLQSVKRTMKTMRPRKYLSVDELCVLKLLQKHS